MSGGFAIVPVVCNGQSIGAVTATSLGTVLTAGTNAYSTWTQLTAATTYDCIEVHAWCYFKGAGFNDAAAIALGIGTAGSEQTIIADMLLGFNSGQPAIMGYVFPLYIKAGTRIAAQAMCRNPGGSTLTIQLKLFDGSFTNNSCCAGVDSMGFVPGGSNLYSTPVAPSATANTLGSWVQIIASTSKDYSGLWFAQTCPGGNPNQQMVQFAVGGAGSEVVISPFQPSYNTNPAGAVVGAPTLLGNFAIPKGSRLSAQTQSTTASDNALPVVLYGMYS